jgi:hypothetical protein
MDFGKEDHRGKELLIISLSTWPITVDVDLDHIDEVVCQVSPLYN